MNVRRYMPLAVAAGVLISASPQWAQEKDSLDLARATAVGHYVGAGGTDPGEVRVEPATWPNGALGLNRPDEAAIEVLIKGHRVTVADAKAPKQTREYRVGSGQVRVSPAKDRIDVIRIAAANAGSEPLDLFRAAAIGHFAGFTGGTAESVNVTPARWPNGALGLERPGEITTLAIVPGHSIVIRDKKDRTLTYRVGPHQMRVRTGADRIDVIPLTRLRPAKAAGQAPVVKPTALVLTRQGGFAGFNDEMLIRADGTWSGKGRGGAAEGSLDAAQLKLVQDFLAGDLWRKHQGEVGKDIRIADGISLGYEVRAGDAWLGRLVIHELENAPAPVYGELSQLFTLLYAPRS